MDEPLSQPTRRELATAYLLAHPEEKDIDVMKALQCNATTVSRARRDLVSKGLISPLTVRKYVKRTPPPLKLPTYQEENEVVGAPSEGVLVKPSSLSTPDITKILDIDIDNIPDEETRKKMLREVRTLAFGVNTNSDTKLSAIQLWVKIKDSTQAKELGPGPPMTKEAAVTRLSDLMTACGLEIVTLAYMKSFPPQAEVTDEGKLPSNPSKVESSAAGPSST